MMRFKVNRRAFLHLMAPPLLLPGTAFRAMAQAANDALFLLVDGIDPATPADRLSAFLDPFLDGDIPIGLVLSAPGMEDPDLPADLADYLRQTLLAAPALVEPVLSVPGLATLPAYFQRRTTSEVMQWLAGLVGHETYPPPLTISTDVPIPANFDALRCLGVRSVLGFGSQSLVSSTGCASLAVCMDGATVVRVDDSSDPAIPLDAAFGRAGWAQIVFSLAGPGPSSVAGMRLSGQRAVDAIAREVERGRRFLALPRDQALWFGEDQSRYIAIRIDGAKSASAALGSDLAAQIRALGIPFDTDQPAIAATDPSPEDPPVDLLLLPQPHASFDDRGFLIRGETVVSDASTLLADSDRMRDAVLSIRSEDYATPAALAATLDALRLLQGDPGTKLVDLPAFLRLTVSPDPAFDLLRGSRRDGSEPADPDPLSAEDWMADARQAWTFFERFSNPATGLCVDTADVQGDDQWLHSALTMWDLGSLIAGVMAAHELGLLTDTDFVARAEQLVHALPAARIGGRLLPSEVISTDTGRSLSRDFNACDTGRLLSVLRELDAYPLTLGLAEDKTGQWDLESVVVDRRLHSIVDGALVDRSQSHCAHYTARAFRDRGVDVASPYEMPDLAARVDREMLLLLSLGELGPLGAEPLLFEALEMGMSGPSDLLASVLFSAQRDDFERTNTLYCVSEAPLNRAPWFTYQGLNLTAAEDRWMVNAASDDARFATPEFRKETALVNTKAAYLWAAHRPGPYSTLLTRHVRRRARMDGLGFAPGVFLATGESMPGYADVNTNGVILEAIAYILRGHKRRPG